MRRTFLVLVLLWGCIYTVSSQVNVYVIFTSTDSEAKGVWNAIGKKTESVLEARHYFTLFDRAGGNKSQAYFYDFLYEYKNNENGRQAFNIDPSFLTGKLVIDWDLAASRKGAQTIYNLVANLYFIDRKESTSSSYKVYPVRRLKFNY